MAIHSIPWRAGPIVIAAATFFSEPAPGRAQTYPTKTIKLVVPFGPGGPTDVSARVVAEMVTAVLGEQVHMTFPDVSILLPLIQEGKIKALAVTSATRHPQLPNVPTMAESGIADYVTTFWTGVIAPAATPPAIVNALNAAIAGGLRTQQEQHSIARVGAQPAPGSPRDFANFIAAETRKWS